MAASEARLHTHTRQAASRTAAVMAAGVIHSHRTAAAAGRNAAGEAKQAVDTRRMRQTLDRSIPGPGEAAAQGLGLLAVEVVHSCTPEVPAC